MEPGTTVYSTNDCGDYYEGKSVVIPKGIPATFEGIKVCPQVKELRAFFAIPTSPGQKMLTCRPEQIGTFWSETPPPPPGPKPYGQLNVWERLRRNPYAGGEA